MSIEIPLSVQRRRNTLEILGRAWAGQPLTASELIAATGLTRSTVIAVCDELVELGWLIELDNQRVAGAYTKGRPARRYSLRADAGYVIGVDAGEHSLAVRVADLLGRTLVHRTTPVDHEHILPAARLDDIERAVDAALAEAAVAHTAVLALTVGVPAPVDASGHSPWDASGFWARMNPDIVGRFAPRGWSIAIDNDANLAALAEGWCGAAVGVDDYAALVSGERLGGGIVLDGRLLRGARGLAGEMRVLDLVGGVGSADGIAALLRTWALDALAGTDREPSLLDAVSAPGAADVLAAAERGDPLACAAVDRVVDRFTRVVAVLADLLDVSLVIVVGAIAPSIGPVLERVSAELVPLVHGSTPRLVASDLGDRAVTLGALRRGLDDVSSRPLEFEVAAVSR